ncbi:MAG: phosphatase PAP2 family protein [Acidimicrobiales bacterium]
MSLPEQGGTRTWWPPVASAQHPASGTYVERDDQTGGPSVENGPVRRDTARRSAALRLLIGIALYALVAIGGVYFASYPAPTPLDRLADRILPVEYSVHWLAYITDLGRPRFAIPVVVICAVIAFLWDRRRAITCLVAPAAAIGITEYLAKPAVGRLYGGSLSYPSGHMTSVAALVAVFVLAVPPRWRWVALVLGAVLDVIVGVTLILLRWHYLTDVVAGLAVSVATTLIIDTVLHLLPGPQWLNSERRTGQSWRSSTL